MLFILIMLIGLSLAVSGLVMILQRKPYDRDGSWVLCVCGIIIAVAMSFTTVGVYLGNLASIAELQTFHDETAAVYRQAIVEANNSAIVVGHLPKSELGVLEMISKMSDGKLVNLDNFAQSSKITELIRDYRNRIRIYNKGLAICRAYKENIWIWPMMPEIPEHLKLMSY